MFLLKRVRDILLRPTPTWQKIREERFDAGWVFSTYVMPLAAIAALAVFIGLTLVGVGGWESRQRLPLARGLAGLGVGFLLLLLTIFVLARAVNALAAGFGARQSTRRSMMLVGYASTAAFVGALFALVPALAFIGLFFALYSVYLLYTGLPVLMRCPPTKVIAFTALTVSCAAVMLGVLATVLLMLMPSGLPGTGASPAPALAATASGAPSPALAEEPPAEPESPRVAAMSSSMREAQGRLEAARKTGDAATAGAAITDMKAAITRSGLQGIDPQVLKLALPDRLPDGFSQIRMQTHSGKGNEVVGGSEAESTYVDAEKRRLTLAAVDLGARGLMVKSAEWASSVEADPAPGHVDKVFKTGRRTHRELFRPAGSQAEVTIVLANGIIVQARADKSDLPTLRKMLIEVDLGTLEALKRNSGP